MLTSSSKITVGLGLMIPGDCIFQHSKGAFTGEVGGSMLQTQAVEPCSQETASSSCLALVFTGSNTFADFTYSEHQRVKHMGHGGVIGRLNSRESSIHSLYVT